MKETIKKLILSYLKDNHTWIWAGQIEDYIRDINGAKGDTTSRICRILYNEGLIEKQFGEFKGRKYV